MYRDPYLTNLENSKLNVLGIESKASWVIGQWDECNTYEFVWVSNLSCYPKLNANLSCASPLWTLVICCWCKYPWLCASLFNRNLISFSKYHEIHLKCRKSLADFSSLISMRVYMCVSLFVRTHVCVCMCIKTDYSHSQRLGPALLQIEIRMWSIFYFWTTSAGYIARWYLPVSRRRRQGLKYMYVVLWYNGNPTHELVNIPTRWPLDQWDGPMLSNKLHKSLFFTKWYIIILDLWINYVIYGDRKRWFDDECV